MHFLPSLLFPFFFKKNQTYIQFVPSGKLQFSWQEIKLAIAFVIGLREFFLSFSSFFFPYSLSFVSLSLLSLLFTPSSFFISLSLPSLSQLFLFFLSHSFPPSFSHFCVSSFFPPCLHFLSFLLLLNKYCFLSSIW